MRFEDAPIKRKVISLIMFTTGVALVLTCAIFFAHDLIAFRKTTRENLSTLARIVAANSTAALVYQNEQDARETLSALQAEKQIVGAALYDSQGKIFSKYVKTGESELFPAMPENPGYRFTKDYLILFQPVQADKRLGTLYLKFSLEEIHARFRLYAMLVLLIMGASTAVAFIMSNSLQKRISKPIQELANTAHTVSGQKDYSLRAKKYGRDELGQLTDSFNHMMEQIQHLNQDLERRVHLRTAELAASNAELEAFTYSVSHDLRAPLRHIYGYAQIIEESFQGELSPEALKFLQRILAEAKNMGQIVDDLLNLAHVGKREISCHNVSLDSVLAEARTELLPETENRQIEWLIGSLPYAECDPGLMKQVFINLLSNAIKYTRPRKKAVIGMGQKNINGEPVIYIWDNGVGFDMQYSSKIFGVFQRLHRPDQFEGTGVGLATIERIIRKHNGRIWVEAEENKGATFYFTFPGIKTAAVPSPSHLPA